MRDMNVENDIKDAMKGKGRILGDIVDFFSKSICLGGFNEIERPLELVLEYNEKE